MIELRTVEGGVILPVKARPGSKRDAVVGAHGGALKVAVTAAPEKGKANEAIASLLAKALRLHRSDVTLVRGPSTAEKEFFIAGVTRAQLAERIEFVLGGSRIG